METVNYIQNSSVEQSKNVPRQEFLQFWFGDIPADTRIAVAWYNKGMHHQWCESINKAMRMTQLSTDTYETYFGCALYDTAGERKREHVLYLPGVWTEFDHKTPYKDAPERAEVEERIASLPLQPSYVMHSGGGFHLYWKFPALLPMTEDLRQSIIELGQALDALTKTWDWEQSDAGKVTKDAARVLRLPETWNHKPLRPENMDKYYALGITPGKQAVTIFQASKVSYTLEQLQKAYPVPKRPKSNALKPESRPQGENSGRNTWMFGKGKDIYRVLGDITKEETALVATFVNALLSAPLEQREAETVMASAWNNYQGDPATLAFHELNAKHAVVLNGGKPLIVFPLEYEHNGIKRNITDYTNKYSLEQWYAPQGGKKYVEAWFTHPQRRQYTRVVFNPLRTPPDAFNLWHGFNVEPKQGDCSLFLEHVKTHMASSNEESYRYIMTWLAQMIQEPWKKPGTCLAFRGHPGAGKGFFARTVGKLMSDYFQTASQAAHITGRFNAHMANTLLLFCDEAFWAGDQAGKNTLKNLITEPTIRIESKFENSFEVDNYMRLIIAGNDDWIAPADYGERRFATFDVAYDFPDAETRKRYFDAIQAQLDQGGYAALMDYLMHEVDITAVNLQEIPDTKALQEQKLHGLSGIEGFWFELLQRGSFRADGAEPYWGPFPTEKLQELYYRDMQATGNKERRSRATTFGMKLSKLCPGFQKRKMRYGEADDTLCYLFPPLTECREAFEAFLKTKFDWQATGHPRGTLVVADLSDGAIATLLAKMDQERLADVLGHVRYGMLTEAMTVLKDRWEDVPF